MDVDGTLTDGKIYMGQNGELLKQFNVKDGYGISVLLPENDITPIIITARESDIVSNRCIELGITKVYQNVKDKLACMKLILKEWQIDESSVAYIGDDIADLSSMNAVMIAHGLTGCPSDAAEEIKKVSNYICKKRGGDGAVREFIEWMLQVADR